MSSRVRASAPAALGVMAIGVVLGLLAYAAGYELLRATLVRNGVYQGVAGTLISMALGALATASIGVAVLVSVATRVPFAGVVVAAVTYLLDLLYDRLRDGEPRFEWWAVAAIATILITDLVVLARRPRVGTTPALLGALATHLAGVVVILVQYATIDLDLLRGQLESGRFWSTVLLVDSAVILGFAALGVLLGAILVPPDPAPAPVSAGLPQDG